jgi:hypothetical protein
MAYPTIDAPYGLKPVNLIGGQVFAGSTRNLPIAYGYGTNIFYGDFVQLNRGFVNRLGVTAGSSTIFPVGIFLGVSFTNPVTKQKTFSQYWPASTLAGDAQAIICDDPDTVFKAVICSSGTTIGSAASAMVGQNMQMLDNTGSTSTGNSANAVAGLTATAATTSTFPVRIVNVVPDTAVVQSYASTSTSTSTITLSTALASTASVVIGSEVGYIATNGQYVGTGSQVASVTNTTTVVMNQQALILGSSANIPSGATVVFTQYPEVLIKLNFGEHAYYNGLGVA